MAKSWETLFNLSSFMKYLLTEVLPGEKVESPSYVLESLYELLNVTLSCIDIVKTVTPNSNKTKTQNSERSIEEILSSSTIKSIDRSALPTLLKSDLSTLSESKLLLTPKPLSKEESNINSGVTNLESKPKNITEEFVKLNNEIHNGKPFGHYCRPCDLVIYSKKVWDKHNSDKLHIFLKENCENKHASCSYCNLIIFSSFEEAEILFSYHQKQHIVSQNISQPLSAQEGNFKSDYKIIKNTKYGETNNDNKAIGRVNDLEANPRLEIKHKISPVFVELDKKMHAGTEKGFYCHTCDKSFDAVNKWNNHFQDEAAHRTKTDSSECFDMCDTCKLVIFAIPSVHILYKSFHSCGHNRLRDKNKKSSTKISIENICATTKEQSCRESYNFHETKVISNRSNVYVIVDQFQDFNNKIHSFNLHGCFYCRPCNAACLIPEEWDKHAIEKKHLQLMASRKFKNWKGTCTYCSLTILGTRDTVKYYMDYHTKDHQQVLSYDEKPIFTTNRRDNRGRSRYRSRNGRTSPSNSVSTLGDDDNEDEEDESEEVDTEETESKVATDDNKESSWYASSREEQLHFLVFKLVNSRIEQKKKTGLTDFGALCMVCEMTVENSFEWQNHIISEDHCQRISSRDQQALIKDLNIVLLGNNDVLEKYKTLVKGNMTFI